VLAYPLDQWGDQVGFTCFLWLKLSCLQLLGPPHLNILIFIKIWFLILFTRSFLRLFLLLNFLRILNPKCVQISNQTRHQQIITKHDRECKPNQEQTRVDTATDREHWEDIIVASNIDRVQITLPKAVLQIAQVIIDDSGIGCLVDRLNSVEQQWIPRRILRWVKVVLSVALVFT